MLARKRVFRAVVMGLAVSGVSLLLAGCGGSGQYAAEGDDTKIGKPGPKRDYKYDPSDSVLEGSFLDLSPADQGRDGGSLPVNKYLWQAALDTLSFLPLASTDPFTGVIATDWGSTPGAPGERFKVTAILRDANLSASSLKVAVYREVINDSGVWVPAPVSPETPLKLEDAILTRARQIRVAALGGSNQS